MIWCKPGITGGLHFPELPEAFWVVLAKAMGAILGSAVSIAYVLPRGRREAAIRFVVGIIFGVIFGPAVGAWTMAHFEIEGHLSKPEVVMMGSAVASLAAWWALGFVRRFLTTANIKVTS